MAFDWKCSITVAILTVLIYLLFIFIGSKVLDDKYFGYYMLNSNDWYKSPEVIILLSSFIAFIINKNLIGC